MMEDKETTFHVARIPLNLDGLASHFFAKTIEIQAELDTVRSLLCQILAEMKQTDLGEVESMAQSIYVSHSARRFAKEVPEPEVSEDHGQSDEA